MARRRIIRFAVLSIVSYAVAMAATIPASVAFRNKPWRAGVAGTLWNGEVGLTGGATLRWNWAPLRSLTSLGFAVDWKATGPDTDLGGRAIAGFGGTSLDTVSGTANAALLDFAAPNLPFTCDLTGQIEFDRIALGGSGQMIAGRARSDPGSCRPRGAGAASALPALILTADKIGNESRIRIVPATQRRKVLVDGVLQESGTLSLSVTPEGAAMLPFLGIPPGAKLDVEL